MSTINQLNAVDSPESGDLLALYIQQSGDARKLSFGNLLAWIQSNVDFPAALTKQYSIPSTGFNVSVTDGNYWLILSPAGTLATGTITLPSVINLDDGDEILVNSTQTITSLTINDLDASSVGMPTTIGAGGSFRLKFDSITQTWYKVG